MVSLITDSSHGLLFETLVKLAQYETDPQTRNAKAQNTQIQSFATSFSA